MKPKLVPRLGWGADVPVTPSYLGAPAGRLPCLPSTCQRTQAALLRTQGSASCLQGPPSHPPGPGVPALPWWRTPKTADMCPLPARPWGAHTKWPGHASAVESNHILKTKQGAALSLGAWGKPPCLILASPSEERAAAFIPQGSVQDTEGWHTLCVPGWVFI